MIDMDAIEMLSVVRNKELHDLLQCLLSRRLPQLELYTATNHELALTVNSELRPLIVLIDLLMVRGKNLSLISSIRSDNAGTKIFILSPYECPAYAETVKINGADGFLCISSETFIADFLYAVSAALGKATTRYSSGC